MGADVVGVAVTVAVAVAVAVVDAAVGTDADADAGAGACGGGVGAGVSVCGVGAARAAVLARWASRSSMARLYVSAIVSGREAMLLSTLMPFESRSGDKSGLGSSTILGGGGK